jgi:hypothetical protein
MIAYDQFIRTKRRLILKNYKIKSSVLDVKDAQVNLTSESGKSTVSAYLQTGPTYFNGEEKKLRLFLSEVKLYISCNNVENAAPDHADIFICNFPCRYKLYGCWC